MATLDGRRTRDAGHGRDRRPNGGGRAFAAIAGLVALGALVFAGNFMWNARAAPRASMPASQPQALAAALLPPAERATDAVATADPRRPAAAVPARHEGMTDAQWAILEARLAGHPDREAELARVARAMAFRARVLDYRRLRGDGARDRESTRTLAAWLEGDLPERLAQREMSLGEALRLQDALSETLHADVDARAAARRRLTEAVPSMPEAEAATAADQRFKDRAAALVAEWQALPADERTARPLEPQLDALRRSVYDADAKTPSSP